MFGKEKKDESNNNLVIKKLMDELEEAKRLTPTTQEVFDDIDWSCLWNDEIKQGGLMSLLPIISVIISFIILIIVLVKK